VAVIEKAPVPVTQPPAPSAPPPGAELSAASVPEILPPRSARVVKRPDGSQAAVTATAQVLFAVLPWGEIYVDGKFQGVSPPLRLVEVAPGRHTIEVRNTTFPPHTEVIDLKAEDKVRVRHRFVQEAKP
jgi:serine/threonine-protein kinase